MKSQPKRILIIGAEVGQALAVSLKSEGYETKFIEAYADPLPETEVFSELSDRTYDIIIASYWSCLDLLLEIRERFPKLKTAFLNSHKYEWDETARKKGVDIVLRVPFEQDELSSAIRKILPR